MRQKQKQKIKKKKKKKEKDKKKTKEEKEKEKKAESYYKVIDGEKYDRGMIEKAEKAVEGVGDGRVSVEDAKTIIAEALDGNRYTKIEQKTMKYIREHFKWTEAAVAYTDKALEEWEAKKAEQKKEQKKGKKEKQKKKKDETEDEDDKEEISEKKKKRQKLRKKQKIKKIRN